MGRRWLLGVSFFCLLTVAGFAQEQPALTDQFSADMESKTKDGGLISGKMFIAKDKGRWEMPGMVTISRIDKKIGWVVFPEQKMFMEVPIKDQEILFPVDKFPGETQRQLLGEETVDGRLTEKFEVTYNLENGVEKRFMWITKDAPKLPIRSEAADGSWYVLYKNLVSGTQPDDLFEVPAGYQKFDYGQSDKEKVTIEGGTPVSEGDVPEKTQK